MTENFSPCILSEWIYMDLIAFVGFKGAGKNTAAVPLRQAGYVAISFADALKDALAAIFCWPRHMLEGDTRESRFWREQVDPWWEAKLDMPGFSPRMAMQFYGTEVMRQNFRNDIWIFNVERRIMMLPPGSNVVLVDGRFRNEIALARRFGGRVYRIQHEADPHWYDLAVTANQGDRYARDRLVELGIHESEYAWIGAQIDDVITNAASINDLHDRVARMFLSK